MTEYDDDIIDEEEYGEDGEELSEEEEIDHNRRRILTAVGAGIISLPFIALGLRKGCLDWIERGEARELAEKMENHVDRQGRKLYFYDDVTEQYFLKYVMRDTNKAFPKKVKLVDGKPVKTKAWKIIEEIPEDQREIVQVEDCNGSNMYDIFYRPVKLARMAAEKMRQADELFYKANGGTAHIQFTTSFRDNLYQYRLVKKKEATGRPRVVGPVGGSRHQLGLAVDIVNFADADKWLVRSNFVGGMYGSSVNMRHNDAWHFSYDFKGYKGGKANPQARYNELIRDVTLNEEVKKSILSDLPWVGDAVKDAFYKTGEWTVIKKRYIGFLLNGKGTEAYNYGAGRIRQLLDD